MAGLVRARVCLVVRDAISPFLQTGAVLCGGDAVHACLLALPPAVQPAARMAQMEHLGPGGPQLAADGHDGLPQRVTTRSRSDADPSFHYDLLADAPRRISTTQVTSVRKRVDDRVVRSVAESRGLNMSRSRTIRSPASPSRIPAAATVTKTANRPSLFALAIWCAIFLVYLPSLSAGFIWDDDDYVTQNPTLRTIRRLAANLVRSSSHATILSPGLHQLLG